MGTKGFAIYQTHKETGESWVQLDYEDMPFDTVDDAITAFKDERGFISDTVSAVVSFVIVAPLPN